MRWLALLLLSLTASATTISTPQGGFLWNTPPAITVGNVDGEYSATMPEIYSLQFGQDFISQFYFKLGDTEYTGVFSDWSFQNGLFSGTFTGNQISFYPGSWSYFALAQIHGSLTQQLNLLPGCQGYACGSMAYGSLNLSSIPEPSTWILLLTGLSVTFIRSTSPSRLG